MIKNTLHWNEQALTRAWEALFVLNAHLGWLTGHFRCVRGSSGVLPSLQTKAIGLQNIPNPRPYLNTREIDLTTFFSCSKWVLKCKIYNSVVNFIITLVKTIVDLLLWPHRVKERENLEPGCRSAQWDPREVTSLYLNGLRQIFKWGLLPKPEGSPSAVFPSFHPAPYYPSTWKVSQRPSVEEDTLNWAASTSVFAANSFWKGQIENILGTTFQLCHCSREPAIDNM